MLDVHFTIDVEIWCDGWDNIDREFNDAFKSYIYGPTKKGFYGLPYTLKELNDHGLTGTFFVEPLFSLRFGAAPLQEVVNLILDANQLVELHLHTEWIDEARDRPLPYITEKRQHLRYFSQNEQKTLISIGKDLLIQAGVPQIDAFRAGSFGFDINTLSALQQTGIYIDSSYNATRMGLDSGLMPGQIVTAPLTHDGISEFPMTVYFDRPGHLRHAQLCACSSRELEGLMWRALEEGRSDFVILSHSFELMGSSRTRSNPIIVKRLRKLCEFLDKNRDCFRVEGFSKLSCSGSLEQPLPLKSPSWTTGLRVLEQAWSRFS
jgi:hypothetical protein